MEFSFDSPPPYLLPHSHFQLQAPTFLPKMLKSPEFDPTSPLFLDSQLCFALPFPLFKLQRTSVPFPPFTPWRASLPFPQFTPWRASHPFPLFTLREHLSPSHHSHCGKHLSPSHHSHCGEHLSPSQIHLQGYGVLGTPRRNFLWSRGSRCKTQTH